VPSSGHARLAAAAAALVLAACQRTEPEVRPFHVQLVNQDGAPIPAQPDFLPDSFVVLRGVATRVGPGELVVADSSLGPVTVTFDAASHPGVAFPIQLHLAEVRLAVGVDPGARAPDGSALPYPALRVGLATPAGTTFQLLLVDSPYADDRGLGAKPRPIGPELDMGDDPTGFPDFPDYEVAGSSARFEPGDCGLVYHDHLVVLGDDELARLWAGDRATTNLAVSPDPWTTLHVDSWHRAGSCGDRAKTWTQWAAWR